MINVKRAKALGPLDAIRPLTYNDIGTRSSLRPLSDKLFENLRAIVDGAMNERP